MIILKKTVETIYQWLKSQLKILLERRWIDLGIRSKMGSLVTIGMLGLMTIFGVLAISSARQATEQALNERLIVTQMGAEILDNMLLHIMNDMAYYAQLLGPGNPNYDLSEQENRLPQISYFDLPLYYIDPSGEIINTTAPTSTTIRWKEVPAVQSAYESRETSVSAWSQYQPGTIFIATPIEDNSGNILGVLAALVNLSDPYIFPIENSFNTNHSQVVDLVDREGRIVYSNHEDRIQKIITEEFVLSQLFTIEQAGVETCLGCPGVKPAELSDEVVSFAPLTNVPYGVVIRQPAKNVFSSVRNLFIWHTLLGFISIVGALGLVWTTTNNVITPLKTLTDAAKRIASGDLKTPLDPLYEPWFLKHPRKDEIGALGESFDSMRIRLKESIDEVQALNRDLDERVKERSKYAIASQKEAQAARDDLQAIIDALSDEMIVIDVEKRRVVQVNQICREKNIDLGNITRLSCYELFHSGHPCDMLNFTCPLDEVVETGKPVRVTHCRTTPDPSEPKFLDIIASPLRDDQGRITRIVELIRDVTEEHQLRESLVRRNQQLAILNAVATTVNKSLDIKEILELALKEVIQHMKLDVGAIFLKEHILGQLNLVAHFGLSEETAQMVSQFGMLESSCGGVIENKQLVVVPDITKYRGQRARTLRNGKLTTLIHVPLTSKGSVLGSLCVGTYNFNEFSENEQNMFTAIGQQISVAIENAQLYAELQQKELVRKELFRKAINAQEDERKRIARELHDDTSQALTALIFAAEEGLEIDDLGEIQICIERMLNLTHQTLDGVHKLLFDLRPSILDHLGLMPAIRWFAKSRLEPLGVRVSFREENNTCRLYPETEIALFRVIQEAITNITRHAGARNVNIHCQLNSDQAKVEITDDGVGFDHTQAAISPETGHGFGILGMSERLELVGGDFEINSTPGEGTRIDIHVPLQEKGRKR